VDVEGDGDRDGKEKVKRMENGNRNRSWRVGQKELFATFKCIFSVLFPKICYISSL
jgi:hypothetical protein